MQLSATLFNYWFVCKRKCWLHAHHINLEKGYDDVELGKFIHETTYQREKKKEISIEGIKIDYIDGSGAIHEVKKSSKMEHAHIWQLKYYLYVLWKIDIHHIRAYLDYPKQRKKLQVLLLDEDISIIEKHLQDIHMMLACDQPPKKDKKSICCHCSYEEFCWG